MELLCVLAAVAALFLLCAALTLKARVPAGIAPLTALSAIAAVFTLAGMAGALYPAAWAVYGLLSRLLSSVPEGATEAVLSWRGNAVAALAAILVAVAVYGALVVALRALSREDLALMPKGDKIARLLRLKKKKKVI